MVEIDDGKKYNTHEDVFKEIFGISKDSFSLSRSGWYLTTDGNYALWFPIISTPA